MRVGGIVDDLGRYLVEIYWISTGDIGMIYLEEEFNGWVNVCKAVMWLFSERMERKWSKVMVLFAYSHSLRRERVKGYFLGTCLGMHRSIKASFANYGLNFSYGGYEK